MGNMLPACLVHHSDAAAALSPPGMKHRQRLVSLRLLVKAVNKMMKKKRPGSTAVKQPKIGGKSSPFSSAAEAHDEKGGGGGGEVEATTRKINHSNPKSNVLRSSRVVQPGARGGECNKKGVVRVKVVLTKEDAARLLTLTVGGKKTAEQVVAEIKRLELRRAANAAAAAWRPALERIPEESS